MATAADFIFKGIHDKAMAQNMQDALRFRIHLGASREYVHDDFWQMVSSSVRLEGGRQGFSRAQGPDIEQ